MNSPERKLSYWKDQLRDLSPVELPSDRPRSSLETFRSAFHVAEFPPGLTEPLRNLGLKEEVTLFVILLAAFQVLLHRYTGQDDIAVGTPIAGRNGADMEESAGFFASNLVVRIDTTGDPPFRELLKRVRRVTLDTLAYQDPPLDKPEEELYPEDDLSRTHPVKTTFAIQSVRTSSPELPGLALNRAETGYTARSVDLKVYMEDTKEGLKGEFIYNAELFDGTTVERMARHYQRILEGIIVNPGQRLSELPLLSESERHQMLTEWNDTATDYPRDKCIHELFEEQVGRAPRDVAVVFKERKMTYSELNERANQVARRLRSEGVRSDVIVGIMVNRSIDMIVGLLGVLKARGAYLPIDPELPDSRIEYMLKDSGAPIVLTQESLMDRLKYDGSSIALDNNDFMKEDVSDPGIPGSPGDLAYVIYTSGSTGTPKGVMLEHRGVVNLSKWFDREYDLAKNNNVIQNTTFSFDVAMEEIISTLINGACLFIPEKEETLDKDKFRAFISKNKINIAQFVPVTMREFLADTDKMDSLNIVICAGEALDEPLKEQILQKGYTLYNNYGPSEATVDALSSRCSTGKVTVGKPIFNMRCYILDKRFNPVPVGVAGELIIGGDGLARGYLNRPELTADKFIPDPFSGDPGARLYRTGDLARYLPDGNVEFLGRIDNQVKVRGHRIEPGEIESLLRQHPAVREAAVAPREDPPGGKHLVAYVVARGKSSISVDGLRSLLKEKLPNYMLPSFFVVLDSLPLTQSGKVDRKSLPAPDPGRPDLKDSFVAPHTPTEELIAGIWNEVLELKEVGINDNFFELGGHSLLATQVTSRMRNAFQVDIPLRSLFEMPTIARLAEEIEGIFSSGEKQPGPIVPIPREGGLPLSFAQERLWFLNQLEPGSPAYNMRLTFRLTGDFSMAALERSLIEVLRRHEVLRTTFVTENDRPVQLIAPPGDLTLPVTDLSTVPEVQRAATVGRLVSEEVSRPFDLAAGPLLRATLLQLDPREHILLLAVHHIISDGWSMDILYQELSALYEAFSRGNPSPLAELPIQYADFAVWQRQWLQGERLERQLSYWKKQLGGDLPMLELPTDYSRPQVQTHRGGHCALQLSRKVSTSLNALSQREGITPFMAMLAAFKTLLHRLSAQDDIVVGTPVAGRNSIETEGLIGFFLNTLVMRTDLSGNPSFRDVLDRVRKTALDAYAHQDVPFEKLVEELRPERDLSRTPLFQVMLNMLNLSKRSLEIPEMREEMIEVDSKFDLTLYVSPLDDGMILDLVYNADLFHQSRMTEMLEQMRYLLEQIVEDPDKSIRSYSLLTPRSAHLLPDPREALPEPKYPPVMDMFLSHVDRSPNHPAVSQDGHVWTYEQLSESIHHLARILRTRGIEKGDVVMVTGSKSFGIIAGMAAVLLSGGVLLTIDKDLPSKRKRLMCREAKARCMLQVGDLKEDSPWIEDLFPSRSVAVDRDTGLAVDVEKTVDLAQTDLPDISPEDAAYIFFTSGTTGIPKGVLGCHKGLSHFLSWQRDKFEVGPLDRCAQLTNLSFDVVLRDIFLPLVSGATLCLPGESSVPAADMVLPWMDREGITRLHTVPSLAQTWLKDVPKGVTLKALACVYFAGEPLTESLMRKWRESFPGSGRIVNLYGPTETTLAKCFYEIPSELSPGVQPVGKTLPHTQALVLSESLAQCGVNEPGEIFLRTPYRTLGYINAYDEQQKRFIRNPFRNDISDILYRTGDRGRYRADGLVDVLGRLDDQVKIRGVRVEPAEVTAVLSRQPEVSSSVVIAGKNSSGENVLTAYVVPSNPEKVSAAGLRSSLSGQLPAPMVPSHFVILEALPLTANGKVDKRALPAPDIEKPDTREDFLPPRTPLEESLASMWSQVLGLERVGIHDNFFELGGHSLIATQVASRIRRDLDLQVTVRGIFEHPTIELLALHLIEKEMNDFAFEDIDELLSQVESMSDSAAERLLAQDNQPGAGDDGTHGDGTPSTSSPFYCPRKRSDLFGRQECNLRMVINENFDLSELENFDKVAQFVRELDPSINVAVMSDLGQRIAELSPEKRALIERRFMQKAKALVKEEPISRRETSGPCVLSFAQERMWLLHQMEPGSSAYNMPLAVRLVGQLNVTALEQSIGEILRRHEVLRTTFVTENERPVQKIDAVAAFSLQLTNLGAMPEKEREGEVQQLASQEASRPFDLAAGPLLRAKLLQLNPQEHVLLLTMHHIVSDGWSMGILYRELSILYEAFSKGKPSPLPELPIQYADFSAWQRQWLRGDRFEKQLSYWKEQLRDLSPLELPTDRARPAVQTFHGADHAFEFPVILTEELRKLCQKEGATLFMLLLAAFQSLLHRYAGQEDIAVGTPVANRNRAETEGLIGFFVNTLVMRTDTSGDPVFRELLKQVRKTTLNAYTHQALPFEQLVRELRPERDLSRNPLFQVMFALQNVPRSALNLSDLMLSRMQIEDTRTRFDLEVYLWETAEGLKGEFVYNTDLFDGATIERMAGHYQKMIEGIVTNPGQRLSELPLLTEAEKHQLLVEWNDTATDYPRDRCIHELFEEQVERTPDAVAVIFEKQKLTYRELNSRANQLAHYLRKRGVGPDVLVGICVERSPEMVIGILGILKAGGAYVPLDPTYPQERLSFMIEDTLAPAILAQHHLAGMLPKHAADTIFLDADLKKIKAENKGNPMSGAAAGNLAYVIYTSGSTGKPKGVCVTHQAVNRLVLNTDYIKLEPADRVGQASNISFDAATFELWGALLHGACLVGISKDVALSPAEFAGQIKSQRISALFLTTALFNQMALLVPEAFRSLSSLLFGGEACDPACVNIVAKAGPPQRLLHVYGPTESTTFATSCLVEKLSENVRTIPIGKPIANTTTYILDRTLQPVPVGVTGELFIGGDGLARGYLKRPELNVEKFVPNPFIDEAGERLYRTGDLARYLPDGNIEFMGRIDHQVKIRGFRIEPGEIEAVLAHHQSVKEKIVVAREDQPGNMFLAAYIVPNEKSPVSGNDLRKFLKGKLPDYMVPSAFVMMDSLPLTPNGKVDRKALPVPDHSTSRSEKIFVAPRNTLESQLTGIWGKVLGVQQVGITDNFFELGGHSLLAVRLAAEIKKITGSKVPVMAIFKYPTIEQLADLMTKKELPARLSSLVSVRNDGAKQPFYWVHGQETSPILSPHFKDRPFYTLLHPGHDGKSFDCDTVEKIAAHYVREIKAVQPEGPYLIGGFCFGGVIAFEMAQKLSAQGGEVSVLCMVEPSMRLFPRAALINAPSGNNLFLSRSLYHFKRLSASPAGGKPEYVLRRLQSAASLLKGKLWAPISKKVSISICRACVSIGLPLPASFRSSYLLDMYDRATERYNPRKYHGRMLLCHTDKVSYGSPSDIESMASGGVEVHEVRGATHHDIMREPNVGAWIQYLEDYLSRLNV